MKEKTLINQTDSELSEIDKMIDLQGEATDSFVSSDALHDYLIDIGKIPLLTPTEEKELFEQYALTHDEAIKNKIMCSNLRLVVSVAKKYFKLGLEPLDVIQEGNIGLMAAIDHFDVHKGFRFSTYATWWIRQSVTRSIGYKCKMIRTSIHDSEKLMKINQASNALLIQLERTPSIEEIALETKLPEEEVKRVLAQNSLIVSFSEPVNTDDDASPLEDSILDPECNVEEDVEKEMLSNFLFNVLQEKLKERDLQVIALRWGLFDGKTRTLQDLADYFHLSRERIRQIEARIFQRLKHDPTLKSYFTGNGTSIVFKNSKRAGLLSKEEVYQNMIATREKINGQNGDSPKVKSLKR